MEGQILQPSVMCYCPCSCGNVSLQQQCSSLGFSFEQALVELGKSPSRCAGLGTGMGQGSLAPLLSPTGDFSASYWGSQDMDRAH